MALAIAQLEILAQTIALRWNDGVETFISLEQLRRGCPCAACGGEPDVLGRVSPPLVTYSKESFELKSLNPVGGYALLPHWEDGHSTGIYSFEYLRKLAS